MCQFFILFFFFLLSILDKIDQIYHGCMTKNADGRNRLIGVDKKSLVPTAKPFWKYIEDIETSVVKTCIQCKKQPTVSHKAFSTYFWNKDKEDIERWESIRFETVRPFLRYLMLIAIVFFTIVNNGNILTDGTDERKHLERKYNEL